MLAQVIEATSRAFGMLMFVGVWLSLSNRAFPSNWLLLFGLYIAFIPIAVLYGLVTDSVPDSQGTRRRFKLPKLPVVGAGAAIAIFGYAIYKPQIDAAFFGSP